MSSTERVEWVEIIEPKTKEHMYANLTTGECVWDPPPGVQVKKTDDNQWWELYDQNTARFYYYNASSQKTVWHRPQNCDIIPLAKLQTLKQNTEVQDEEDNKINIKKETVATQTNTKGLVRAPVREAVSNNSNRSVRSITISTQTSPASSPRERRKHHHHHHHHHHHLKRGSSPSSSPSVGPPGNKKQDDNAVNGENRLHSRGGGQQLGSWQQSQSQQTFGGGNVGTKGSSRSSDSSTISQSRSSLEGPGHVLFRRHDSCCSNESGGSANSQRHDVARGRGPDQNGAVVPGYEHRSHHPPEFGISGRQRSLDIDQHPGVHGSSNQMMWRQNSVDSPIGVSRSSSMRMGLGPGRMPEVISDSTPRMQRRIQDTSPGAQDNLGYQDYGTTLDPLSTPVSNRRNWARSSSRSTDSSMSSPQSPLGMPNVQVARDNDGAVLTFGDSGRGGNLNNRQASEDSSPLSLDSSHQNMDSGLESRMSSMESQQRSGVSSGNRNATSPANRIARSSSKSFDRDSQMNVSGGKQPAHSREGSEVSIGSYFHNTIFGDSQKPNRTSNGDSPRLNEQPTPLYSNLDYPYLFDRKSDNQSYLLPLQHYLLEQAKLSGCRFGDFIGDDRDSLSQSDDDSDGRRDEEDDFADDEGMSHQDSSSQEYLDDSRFLDDEDEEEEEQTYCEPMSPPPQHRGKASHKIGLDPRLDHLDYAESDNSSLFSNSPVLPPRNPVSQTGGNISTQHASLRRKRIESQSGPSPALEKSQSFQPDMGQGGGHRPLSLMATSTTESNVSTNPVTGSLQRQPGAPVGNAMFKDKKPPSESDIEKYAQDNLNRHKKGIFRKKFTIQELLSWSKDPIRKPMIMTADKTLKREACEIFKLILTYMGDRKSKGNQTGDSVALDLATRGWSKAAVRDELFIQICRQTTDNPRKESLLLGWELLAICLTFFPPSVKFQPYLESYIGRHKDTTFDTAELKISHYAAICSKRLERIGQSGAKKGLRKPTIEEIDQSRIQIFRPSMFGNTLEEVMAIQKNRYPHYKLPWIQTTLSEAVLKLNGAQTEGIFRVPGDIDEVNAMKLRMDQWEEVEANDPHVPASLLKLWYRELYEPLIPSVFYQECVDQCNEPEVAVQIVQKLPEINRMVLSYLVRFLQVFAAEANSSVTKMDASNLAMVMAPNCLRCMSDDPRIIFENTRKEMAFMRILIQHLDTSYMEGIM